MKNLLIPAKLSKKLSAFALGGIWTCAGIIHTSYNAVMDDISCPRTWFSWINIPYLNIPSPDVFWARDPTPDPTGQVRKIRWGGGRVGSANRAQNPPKNRSDSSEIAQNLGGRVARIPKSSWVGLNRKITSERSRASRAIRQSNPHFKSTTRGVDTSVAGRRVVRKAAYSIPQLCKRCRGAVGQRRAPAASSVPTDTVLVSAIHFNPRLLPHCTEAGAYTRPLFSST